MAILDPSRSEKELEKLIAEIKNALQEHEFTVVDEDIWGIRHLAYKIQGKEKGYYIILNFTGEGKNTLPFKRDLRLMQGIMRTLFIKVDDNYKRMRFDDAPLEMPEEHTAAGTQKLSDHAKALSEKVAASASESKEDKEDAKSKDEDLDEKVTALVEDADIDL